MLSHRQSGVKLPLEKIVLKNHNWSQLKLPSVLPGCRRELTDSKVQSLVSPESVDYFNMKKKTPSSSFLSSIPSLAPAACSFSFKIFIFAFPYMNLLMLCVMNTEKKFWCPFLGLCFPFKRVFFPSYTHSAHFMNICLAIPRVSCFYLESRMGAIIIGTFAMWSWFIMLGYFFLQ